MGRLLAVSNRTASDPNARAGGLAVALWEALTENGGSWFGWSGETVEKTSLGSSIHQDEGVEFNLVDLTAEEHDGFYLSYSNQVIWPVFHYRVDLARFNDSSFRTYASVNDRFAHLIANRAREDDIIWAHDYHFLLLGEALRREGWRGPTGFFLHIPFPSPEVFSAIPQHHWLARALCHYDVVGFQSEQDRNNFVRYLVTECDGFETGNGYVEAFGRRLKAAAYPIGIDADNFRKCVETDKAKDAVERISRFLGGRELVIGVDRMDYSKGLPQRFEAVGALFDHYPETRGKVSVTQIAPPSRSKVEEYKDLRTQLDSLAGRINGDYGDLGWLPLRYLARSYDREELAGLFSIARVGLVTPLRDGMNLVAKEYVAAQNPEDPGVLILSEFAGAAEQMDAALIVNPHDTTAMAETIKHALDMSLSERQERWSTLNDIVKKYDITWWREQFLSDLNRTRTSKSSENGADKNEEAKVSPLADARKRIVSGF